MDTQNHLDFYQFPSFGHSNRKDNCHLCGKTEGHLVGKMNYIGLGNYDMVQCPQCGLICFDPIPTSEIVQKGCELLYRHQQSSLRKDKVLRGFARSYRRGGYFARKYLKKHFKNYPSIQLLEVGAGDGYFSQGIKKVLPKTEISYIDIVPDLVNYYQKHFSCETFAGEFHQEAFSNKKFDIIILRDLLEHLRDPTDFLKQANKVLNRNGHIFFITPNGKEDFWLCSQRYLHTQKEHLILLNHFHYFLPESLNYLLSHTGFKLEVGFKYGLKGHKKGLGHKEIKDFKKEAPPKEKELKNAPSITEVWKHDPKFISKQILHNQGVFSKLYGLVSDTEKSIVNFFAPEGHEFFVLAKKVKDL